MAEQHILDVESFTYIGSIINKTGGTEEDIKSRIGKARHVFVTLEPVWNSRNIIIKTKLNILSSKVKFFFVIRLRDMEAHQSTRLKTPTPAYDKSSV